MEVENKQQKDNYYYGDMDGFLTSRSLHPRPKTVAYIEPRLLKRSNVPDSPLDLETVAPIQVDANPVASPPETVQSLQSFVLDLPEDKTFKKRTRNSVVKKRVLVRSSLLMVLLTLVGVGSFLSYRALHTVDTVFHGNVISDATAAFNDTPLAGESTGRVNILLAGDSADDPDHGGADLTDSILILSINTRNHTAFLLSVPRDLWVDIPGYGWQKINAANDDLGTNFPGYPQNGMGQLEHIVATDLGIPIDYYALSDYEAFKDAVNAVGGVTVDIQSPDPRGLFDAFTNLKLPNGEDYLNGQEALNLARARGDGSAGDVSYGFPQTDFDRTMHQRQLFMAIADKAKTLGFLDDPVRISDLMNAFSNNVSTDLTFQNILRLAQITKGINLSSIQSYSYCATLTPGCAPALLTNYTDPVSGEEALAPTAGLGNYSQMTNYYQELTSSNPIVKEAASVVLLNASDVNGLAKQQQAVLASKGVNVATVTDANNVHATTMIINNSDGSAPDTLKLLQQLYPGSTVTSDTASPEAEEAQGYTADFVVVLGQNWDTTNSPQP